MADPVSLRFDLEVEDGWPPVAVECLPFTESGDFFQLMSPPLFVKRLSVGDLIRVEFGEHNAVERWQHEIRSRHTTVWLARLKATQQIETILAKLEALGCYTVRAESLGVAAIDVPESVPMSKVDAVLNRASGSKIAIAFPSFRHG